MRPQDIISIKRDGGELSDEHLHEFILGVCDKSWADYQISALMMAIFIRGVSKREGETLVAEMLNSGEILDLSHIAKPKVDKHSTGGVGDKTSLIIAPLAAACGLAVPMISGRGLGHTGGTLDKLEAIPRYNVRLTTQEFYSVIEKCGFAMAGQTAEIAPADKKLYALRDATATVPFIPLIVASIMSKKLAEGLDVLVLDVKTGSGAFMESHDDAVALARSLVATGERFNVKTQAVISDMSQPLGEYVGNAHEVYECIKILRNEIEDLARPTWELSLELTARMLVLGGISSDLESAKQLCIDKLENGEALELFRRNVECQGGDSAVCDDPATLLTQGLYEADILANRDGVITSIDTCAIGNAVSAVGGGRIKADDKVDHAVGYSSRARIGDAVSSGAVLGRLFCRSKDDAERVVANFVAAYTIGKTSKPISLIHQVIG